MHRYRSYRGYNYDAAYTSHAHGWSSGPTSALTFYVLGLTVTAPMGETWAVRPHIGGGVPNAEGGFGTALGWFGVKWVLGTDSLEVDVDTPTGTSGVFGLPSGLESNWVTVDGKNVTVNSDGQVAVEGGIHTITVVL